MSGSGKPTPPFAGLAGVRVVFPDCEHAFEKVLRMAASAIARELGAPLVFEGTAPARWLIGPATSNRELRTEMESVDHQGRSAPYLYVDRSRSLLITDAPSQNGVWETFSLLRSLKHYVRGFVMVEDCASTLDAIQLVTREVRDTYPSFRLRGLDWDEIVDRNAPLVEKSDDPFPAFQSWLAELADTHTWVRPSAPFKHVPYEAMITQSGAVALTDVPEVSAGFAAGARRGWELLGEDAGAWWRRTAATHHARPYVAGRRLLVGDQSGERVFVARSAAGESVEWAERLTDDSILPAAESRLLPSGAGLLRIRRWTPEALCAADAVFAESRGAPGLVVDLRGNGGGDITIATAFRDRFIDRPRVMGTIRYSLGHNELSPPDEIRAEPTDVDKRWSGRVRFLTDALTYSSSEDALLGLQGLENVEVWGAPSGGGSGRQRTLRLLHGCVLTISTALTYDRNGRCIEGSGIPVDRMVPSDPLSDGDHLLEAAAVAW